MQETGSNTSLTTNIISGYYSEHLSGTYDLFIFISESEISCAVAEKKNNLFIALECREKTGEISLDAFLNKAIAESEILKNSNYRRVICCTGFRNGTIIPDALFAPESAKDQLLFSSSINNDEEIIVDEIQQIQAKIIFSVPAAVYKTLTTHFRNIELHHTATAVTGYLVTHRRNAVDYQLNINLHSTFFEVYVTKGNQLVLYNVFNFHSAEEMIYYMLFICEQLHLNPESIELEFSGKLQPDEELYLIAEKYFRNINFASRPENFNYDFGFDELPQHVHFNLFSQIVCAS